MTRKVTVKTPSVPEKFLLRRMTQREELGRLFTAEVELLSVSGTPDFDALLGKDLTVCVEIEEGQTRYFHGLVAEFSQAPTVGRYFAYRARLVPWLWLLTQTTDCRAYQNLTVPEIIDKVLREQGLTDFSMRLQRSRYRNRELCVQYRESDWDFISRLMEQEGIYFYTEHQDGKHRVIFVDAIAGHPKVAKYQPIVYQDEATRGAEEDRVYDWSVVHAVHTGKVVLKDYDFIKSRTQHKYEHQTALSHARAKYERFDYPGDFVAEREAGSISTYGKQYAQVALEAFEARHERARGVSDAYEMFAGGLFKLSEHPRKDQNREYLAVACTHTLVAPEYESAAGGERLQQYVCELEALASRVPFRLPQITEHPFIPGLQTAIVVGSSGEEIWTDAHARVRLQFHWDRYGQNDERSSCWVRVAQLWAGKNWGAQFIPRMGQEVVVSFLEGDPDHPLVIGSVYNDINPPPYALPTNKTQSGVKSRSSKGGAAADFNELRFEDKKGEEEVYLHAQKNLTEMVENDHKVDVGHDETEKVARDLTREVGNNETVKIKVNYAHEVGGNENRKVTGSRSRVVQGNEDAKITGNRKVAVTGNETHEVTGNESIKSSASMTLEALTKVTIKCGATSVELTPAGLTIKAPMVTIEGTGKVEVKSSGLMQISGALTTVKGNAILQCEAGGPAIVKGAIVLIN